MRKTKTARPSFEEFSNMIIFAVLDWLSPYALKFQRRYLARADEVIE